MHDDDQVLRLSDMMSATDEYGRSDHLLVFSKPSYERKERV